MKDITDELPQVIADHVAAHNRPDPQAFLATFASDAMLNDAQREFLGHEAIRTWAAKEIFGDNVTMEVQRAWEHPSGVILHVSATCFAPACDLLRWKICNIHAGPFIESWAQRIAVATIHHMQSANTFLRRFEMLKHP
jgi:hypothetical protein